MSVIAAIGWDPWFRGVLTVIIAVFVLCGSVYMILGTNMGARLAFLVSLAALAGWMFIMGGIWWSYGKGLLGEAASWKAMANKTILQDTRSLTEAGALNDPVVIPDDATETERAALVEEAFVAEGWVQLDASLPSFQQAGAAASVFLEESGALAAGEFQVMAVFDTGGERYPKFWGDRIDFFAFLHKPHYVVVEVAPLVEQRVEPGRAPARPVVDESQPRQYVYMIRDRGSLRYPAAYITIGSLMVFLVLCYLLHSRDKTVAENRSRKALPAKA